MKYMAKSKIKHQGRKGRKIKTRMGIKFAVAGICSAAVHNGGVSCAICDAFILLMVLIVLCLCYSVTQISKY